MWTGQITYVYPCPAPRILRRIILWVTRYSQYQVFNLNSTSTNTTMKVEIRHHKRQTSTNGNREHTIDETYPSRAKAVSKGRSSLLLSSKGTFRNKIHKRTTELSSKGLKVPSSSGITFHIPNTTDLVEKTTKRETIKLFKETNPFSTNHWFKWKKLNALRKSH